MAAFDPETLRLLRRDLAATDKQHSRDVSRRTKLPGNSRSTMADALDRRITAAVGVTRDLERLIAFAESVNQLYNEHAAGLHTGWPRRACDDCPGADGIVREPRSPAAAEVLSRTPLAVAFGDAEPDGGEPR